jgi:putative DNA primase/helicase
VTRLGQEYRDQVAARADPIAEAGTELAEPSPNGQADAATPATEHRLTDLGNARRLVELAGEDLRYCFPVRAWYVWDGRRWCPDATGAVMVRAKASAEALLERGLAAKDDGRKRLVRHALDSQDEPALRRAVVLAQSEPGVPVLPGELDADPWLLNTPGGTVDLHTGEVRPARRGDLITKTTGAELDFAADSTAWDAFLARVLPDEEVRSFVQRAAGYSLVGVTDEEVLLFVHGPSATGKSTFVESLSSAAGDYARRADFASFLAEGRRVSGGAARPDLARLAGCRLVTSLEVDDGRRLAVDLVKHLTGGDRVAARHLHQELFEFLPQFTLWLAANHRPRVPDDDAALWRRILQVPFEITIPEAERDPGVKAELRDPARSGPAVLAWSVQGALDWQARGLDPPEAVRAATAAYRASMDPLARFLEDCCVKGAGFWAGTLDLYGVYVAWAGRAGVHDSDRLSMEAFGTRLKAVPDVKEHRRRQVRGVSGLGLVGTPTQQALGGAEDETAGQDGSTA